MGKPLRVAVIAPRWYPTPPVGYGGIELVVYLLVRGLRERGVEVVLYGAEGSMPGTVELAPSSWRQNDDVTHQAYRDFTYVSRILNDLRSRNVQIIHDNAGQASPSPLVFSQLDSMPVVHTVHGPLTEPYQTMYESLGSRAGLVAISADQRSSSPLLNWAATIHNAVDVEALTVANPVDKEGYLLCLARIAPLKGQHLAIEVARRCGRRLVLAGMVDEAAGGLQYFKEQIEPHVDGKNVTYIENVAGEEKTQLLARAYALLATPQWREPFGLAVVEAMASGTPAVSFRQGAAPELITDGRTGFLVDDVDSMVAAVGQLGNIDPLDCSRLAREHFSPAAMASHYIDLYQGILDCRSVKPWIEVTGSSHVKVGRSTTAESRPLTPA